MGARAPLFALTWEPRLDSAVAWGAMGFLGNARLLMAAAVAGRLCVELLGMRERAARSRRLACGSGAAASSAGQEHARLLAELQEARRQLRDAQAAAADAERRLQELLAGGAQREAAVPALAPQPDGRLGAEVEALRAQLRASVAQAAEETESLAARNAALVAQNEAALAQLRALAASMGGQQAAAAQQQQQQPWQQGAGQVQQRRADGLGGAGVGEAQQLRGELEEARAQLAQALAENAELERRLLHLAFEEAHSPASPSGPLSPPRGGVPLSADETFQRIVSAASPPTKDLFRAAPAPPQQQQQAKRAAGGPEGVPAPGAVLSLRQAQERQLGAAAKSKGLRAL